MTGVPVSFSLHLRPTDESWMQVLLEDARGRMLGERVVDWSEDEAWYCLTSDRRAVHERIERSRPEEGEEPIAALGQLLYQGVLGDELARKILAPTLKGHTVRLEVVCPDQYPRLLTVPWQLLHDGEGFLYRRGISLSARLPAREARLQSAAPPLRVLLVFASPRNAEVPPVEAELRTLEDMYRRLPIHTRVTELRYGVSAEDIVAAWERAGGFHAVHFLCPATDDHLLLEGPGGSAAPLPWSTLEPCLRTSPAPWLVTLGTGRQPRDPWRRHFEPRIDGTAERSGIYDFGQPHDWSAMSLAFARAGVPAVLVYQLPIAARPGRAIAERFCSAALTGLATLGEAWQSAVQEGLAVAEENEPLGAPPAFLGQASARLEPIAAGPTVLPQRARRPGVDMGAFPHKPLGRHFAGRYHTTTRFLREVLFGRDHSALVLGPSGVGKTTLVVNVLRLAADSVSAVRYGHMRPESTVETFYAGVASFCEANGWSLPVPHPVRAGHPDPVVRAESHAECISQALRGRRAILVVDELDRALYERDGHWLFRDPALGMALRHLITHLQGSGLWMLSEHHPELGDLGRPERMAVFRMTEPQPRSAREIFERWPPLAALDTDTQRNLYLASRGLPGLVGSLAMIARGGRLHDLLAELVPRKLHSESHEAFRPHLCAAVAGRAFDALPVQARQLLAFAAVCEKPERCIVAEQLGLVTDPQLISSLVEADLLQWFHSGPEGPDFGVLHEGFLWTNRSVAAVAIDRAPDLGVDVNAWRVRLGAHHAANGVELGRVAEVGGLAAASRRAVSARSRMSFLRAFSYFQRATCWTGAVDMLVRAAELRRDPPYRSELRRMAATLADNAELPPGMAVDVLEVLACLDEDEHALASAADHLERAIWAARTARNGPREAALLFHLADLLSVQGGQVRAADAVRATAQAWQLQDGNQERCRALLSRLSDHLDRTDLLCLWREATGEPLPVDILPL